MLYEVITILNVSLLKQYVVKDEIEHKIKVLEFEIDSLNKLEGDFEKVIKNNVITSYSIHYTKLYDFLKRCSRIRC